MIVHFGGDALNFKLDKEKALCPQICEQLCLAILMGEYLPDEKILSVRETALDFGINPNTVQRAYESLEEQGILYSVRGSGWYVSEDTSIAKERIKNTVKEKTALYFLAMSALGYSLEETKNYVKEWENE
ncbi:MAG: GntR family transcriptional regulator [Ruminococcaceae bacterium]|nr:GntR family transcriptional regulator [Oscillospiraceae bacterium]